VVSMNPGKALFQAFVLPAKRRRYVELLDTKRGCEKIRLGLDHFKDLDPRFCRKAGSAEHNPAEVLRVLKALGAPSLCTVISASAELDGREMPLSDALAEVIGRGQGTFISCLTGELAFFEGEGPNERYICRRAR